MGKGNMEDWKQLDLNVDSLWLIPERAKDGKHKNVYHGNFVPQIPNQLIRRYTSVGDSVLELFSGSGTTLFECENLQRDYLGFDINEQIIEYVNDKMQDCTAINYAIKNVDVTNVIELSASIDEWLMNNGKDYVDFIIAHPPYLDIVKFTNDSRDLSNISDVDLFINKLTNAITASVKFLKKNGYFAVVAGDIYKKSEVIPLAFKFIKAFVVNFKT